MRDDPARILIIGGDDCTITVHFYDPENPGKQLICSEDKVILSIHAYDEVILTTTGTVSADSNDCMFTITGRQTADLQERSRGREHFYHYCVHIYWAGGGRSTPIYNAPFEILPCPDAPGGVGT